MARQSIRPQIDGMRAGGLTSASYSRTGLSACRAMAGKVRSSSWCHSHCRYSAVQRKNCSLVHAPAHTANDGERERERRQVMRIE